MKCLLQDREVAQVKEWFAEIT